MEKCVRCLEYKEPEEFAGSGYTKKKNGEPSTLKICKECKAIDVSIRRYTKQLETLQPNDAKYQEVKQKLDGLMEIEHLYGLRGGKIPQRGVDRNKKRMEEIEARKKQLEELILKEKQKKGDS